MRKSRRALVALATTTLLLTSIAGPASAYDERSGTKTCVSGQSVALSSTVISTERHTHSHRSDAGPSVTTTSGLVVTYSTRPMYRVSTWKATTPGFFSSVSATCMLNPV